jgi:RNA polymerase sigma-70 factor (ECF subfamily)
MAPFPPQNSSNGREPIANGDCGERPSKEYSGKENSGEEPGECGCRAGESVSIEQLVLAHHAAIYRYAFRLTGAQVDAEDLTQQTFLTAQKKLHQLRDAGKALGWLYAVLRSCFLKSRRKPLPQVAANIDFEVEQITDSGPLAPALLEADLDRRAVQAAVDELPDEFKLVVLMFYFEDQSYKEIASELGLPIGTVMSRLSRAKSRLRAALESAVHAAPHAARHAASQTVD